MRRRDFVLNGLSQLGQLGAVMWVLPTLGCRSSQKGFVLKDNDKDLVGSHAAGAETWEPLICETTSKLLGRESQILMTSAAQGIESTKKRICFVGVKNDSAEELADTKLMIFRKINSTVNESDVFELINRNFVEAGLRECGLRPDSLFVPANRRKFVAVMEQQNQPFDYLLLATVNSETTKDNKSTQRNYRLTLELVNMDTGKSTDESAEIRKGYHKSKLQKNLKHS